MIATTAPTDSVTIGSWTIIIHNASDYGTGSGYYGTGSCYYGHNLPTRTTRGEYRAESAAYRETYRRLSRIAQRAADRIERFRKALEAEARARTPRALRVEDVRRLRVAMPDPSQLELVPRPIARRHDRQSVPSRTRRKLRVWER